MNPLFAKISEPDLTRLIESEVAKFIRAGRGATWDDMADFKQEAWLRCLEGHKRFNAAKGSIGAFLATLIRYRLKDLVLERSAGPFSASRKGNLALAHGRCAGTPAKNDPENLEQRDIYQVLDPEMSIEQWVSEQSAYNAIRNFLRECCSEFQRECFIAAYVKDRGAVAALARKHNTNSNKITRTAVRVRDWIEESLQ